MKTEITLDELLAKIKVTIRAKDRAEKTRVNAELKKIKLHRELNDLMDVLRHKEYAS